MGKKAYQLKKEGDFYIIPAGYARGRYHKEIRTMDKNNAKNILAARKSVALKQKYPEIRNSLTGIKKGVPVQINWELQQVKEIPDYLRGGPYILKLQGIPSTAQVTKANESYYKYHGYETVVLKTKDGRYALYVSEQKPVRK